MGVFFNVCFKCMYISVRTEILYRPRLFVHPDISAYLCIFHNTAEVFTPVLS